MPLAGSSSGVVQAVSSGGVGASAAVPRLDHVPGQVQAVPSALQTAAASASTSLPSSAPSAAAMPTFDDLIRAWTAAQRPSQHM